MYDAIYTLVDEKKSSCNGLIRKAVAQVKAKTPESDYPWYPIAKFLFNILGKKNVLMDGRWFLVQIREIVDFEEELAGAKN
ncbi:MAG: hypothetical protein WBN75_05600 [Verrucomicrobiia bacterium]